MLNICPFSQVTIRILIMKRDDRGKALKLLDWHKFSQMQRANEVFRAAKQKNLSSCFLCTVTGLGPGIHNRAQAFLNMLRHDGHACFFTTTILIV